MQKLVIKFYEMDLRQNLYNEPQNNEQICLVISLFSKISIHELYTNEAVAQDLNTGYT